MKKISISLVAIVLLFLSCDKTEDSQSIENINKIKSSLLSFEEQIENDNLNFRKGNYSDENIKTPENEYDTYGFNYKMFLKDLKIFIEANKNNPDLESLVELKISTESSNLKNSLKLKEEISETENLILESFSKQIDLENIIEKSKLYEDFIVNNVSNNDYRKRLLTTVSMYKWSSYYLFYSDENNTFDENLIIGDPNGGVVAFGMNCAYRTGFDACMCRRLQSASSTWTWVDTAQFLLTGHTQMAWHTAACLFG